MANYQVRVTADTKAAARDLTRIDKQLDAITKPRQLSFNLPNYGKFRKSISDISRGAKDAANDVKTFYNVARQVPGTKGPLRNLEEGITKVGTAAVKTTELIKENNSTTKALGNTAKAAGSQFNALITKFAKMGLVLYGLTTATNLLKQAFGGLFNETIGRAAKFQQTLLKTQTTLASTNRVFANGSEITDPLEKINALTGEIGDRVESIRQRSIDLAGVTSNDVVEVFGMVASQISQINGNLEDAEDLAIQFAAALGTFGIPLYQARQEIGSILRGDITVDSYLAKALGITNEDVARAKSQTDGVVGYLNKKLAAAVAGQTLAAKGLQGVLSNIRDIYELIGQAIGEPLLDPIIAASTAFYNILFKSKDLLMDMGKALGSLVDKAGKGITGAFQMDEMGTNPIADAIKGGAPGAVSALKQDINEVGQLLQETMVRAGDAFRTLFTSIAALSGTAVKAMRELFKAIIDISLLKFESLMSALATVAQGITPIIQGVTQLIKVWADLLRLPIVQDFGQLIVTFTVLKATGVIAISAIVTQLILWIAKWKLIVAKVKAGGGVIASIIKTIANLLSAVTILLSKVVAQMAVFLKQQGADPQAIKQLLTLEKELFKIGKNAKGAAFNFRSFSAMMRTAGKSIGVMALNFIKANAAIIAVTLGITLAVDAWGRYTRAQEEARQRMRNQKAIKDYTDNIGKLSRELTEAEEAARQFQIQAANTEFETATSQIRKYTEQIEKLNEEIENRPEGGYGEFDVDIPELQILELQKKTAEERKKIEAALRVIRQDNAKKEIKTLAEQRKGLEKELIEVRRQLEKDLFSQQQQVRRKELEVFRAQIEIMMLGIAKRNRALIKGEQGASRVALEAWGNYIAQKRRGEMDLEAQKKQLTIDVLNLERAAIDYRWAIEKKIAELRRRVDSNSVKQAEAQAQAKDGASRTGGGAATFGKTGNSHNAEGWVHGHFQTNAGSVADLINDVTPMVMKLAQEGVPMYLADDTKIDLELAGKDAKYVQAILGRARNQHGHSGDGRSLDIFVPEGTSVPYGLSDVADSGGRGGTIGTVPGTGRTWVGHLTSDSKSGTTAGKPELESLDIPDADKQAQAFENQQQKVIGLTESLMDLSAQTQSMRTDAAFAELFEQAFPRKDLEAIERQLQRIQKEAAKVLSTGKASNSNQAVNSQIDAEAKAVTDEMQQVRDGINRDPDANEAEKVAAIEKINARQKILLAELEKERETRLGIANAQDAMAEALRAVNEEERLGLELGELQLTNRLQMEGMNSTEIAYEVRKYRLVQKYQKLIEENPNLADSYNQALERQLQLVGAISKQQQAAANPLNRLMSQWKEDLQDVNGYYAQMAQVVQTQLGQAMSSALIGIIDGTKTAQEAFAEMFKNIGKAFIDMATQMIAKALIMKVLGIFLPGAGAAGNMGGSNYYSPQTGLGVAGPNFNMALGGYASTPTNARIGEGSQPEYVIPENKMAASMERFSQGMRGKGVVEGAVGMDSTPSNRDEGRANTLGSVSKQFSPGNNYSNSNNFNVGDGGGGDNFAINITGEQLVFNERNYISQEEIPGIISQASKQGEARTLRKLRMSQNARSKVGF